MPSVTATTPTSLVPLCVDLDGTLIHSDLLWESLVRLLKRNPLYSVMALFWWMKGRANLKAQIAARIGLDPATLPYNEPLIEFLRAEKARGRPVLLVTASDAHLARGVADYVGIFDEVMGSDGKTNLRGKNKGAALAARFGERGFDYAGNSTVDLPVWQRSRQAIVVTTGAGLVERAKDCATIGNVFQSPPGGLRTWLQAVRPHQWVKNLIIFVPLMTSHQIGQWPSLLEGILAFFSFSFCASGVYLLNDLFDLDADRYHATKKSRPFASGELPLQAGLIVFPLMLAAGAAIAWRLSWNFAAVLALYLILTTSYSFRLKQIPLLDVFCLAGLYTIRLVAGHEATGVVYSFWLLVFSMFIFLSLALAKRFVELYAARQVNQEDIRGRGYGAGDLALVAILGPASGYLAALVLALYVNSPEVRLLYRHPTLLLLVCPLLLYWISRVWLLAHRGQLHDDPIVFALKDPGSYLVGVATLAVLWLATGF